jgi:hypothetical protein
MWKLQVAKYVLVLEIWLPSFWSNLFHFFCSNYLTDKVSYQSWGVCVCVCVCVCASMWFVYMQDGGGAQNRGEKSNWFHMWVVSAAPDL